MDFARTPDKADALAALRRRLEVQYALADKASSLSARSFLENVVIDSRPEPRKYADVAEGWQWYLMDHLVPLVESAAYVRRGYRGPRSVWLTLPRGHDKTSSIGRLLGWTLAYTRRQISAVAAAADRDQASILAEFMENEAKLNPWLARRLAFRNYKVVGQANSNLRVLSADAFGSFGLKNDIVICDELTHWASQDLFNVLISGKEKRPDSVFIIISNAGTMNTWQWEALQVARKSRHWWVYEAPGPLSSWMNKERMEEMRKMLPEALARRVLDNEWIDPGDECGFVSRRQASRCAEIGIERGLTENDKGRPGVQYYAGVDYGPVKDRTVCTVLHQAEDGTVIVDTMRVWQGSKERRVPIEEVEAWLEKTKSNFPGIIFVIDGYQMESTIQKYERTMRIERFEPRGGKSNYEMAQAVRLQIVNEKLAWYPNCGSIVLTDKLGIMKEHTLVDEFAELMVRPSGHNYRWDHLPGKHDDRAVSLGMALWKCLGVRRLRGIMLHDAYF